MTTKWIICGQGRGLGKTHLGLALCEVLPAAAYAKLGKSEPKPSKQKNYFRTLETLRAFILAQHGRQHLVLEANQLALEDSEAIVVLLDAPPRQGAPRSDLVSLRERADLTVALHSTVKNWQNCLHRWGFKESLIVPVCSCLAAQHHFLFGYGIASPALRSSER